MKFIHKKVRFIMTVTMYNPYTKAYVHKVATEYIDKWMNLGFVILNFDSNKIIVFNQQRAG